MMHFLYVVGKICVMSPGRPEELEEPNSITHLSRMTSFLVPRFFSGGPPGVSERASKTSHRLP